MQMVTALNLNDDFSRRVVALASDAVWTASPQPGVIRDKAGDYPKGTWLRSPRWSGHTAFTGVEGALIYVKVGHLGASFLTPD